MRIFPETDVQAGWTWQFVQRFLLIWVPLTVVLAGVVWMLYRTEAKATLALTRSNEQQAIQLARKSTVAELHMLHGDVLYLAELSSLKDWLRTGTPSARARLSADWLAFARRRRLYDQIRLINRHGQEVVRINWNHGHPDAVPKDALQNKLHRYYVQDTLALHNQQIYVSPFDLNLEHQAIEQPIKPVIRLGSPVFDPHGQKRGVVVLNYLGRKLLDSLRAIPDPNSGGLWLLNAQGYWLLGRNPDQEWGFMYPKRQAMRFPTTYGQAVWSRLVHGPERAQFMRDGDLFTYARISVGAVLGGGADKRDWIVVSRVPRALLAAKTAGHARTLGIIFLVAALLLALVSVMIAFYGVRRQQSEARVRASEARFRKLLGAAPDAIVIVDANGRITLVNAQAENWFGYAHDELLGESVERLVPERFRDRHRTEREGYVAKPMTKPKGLRPELYALRQDGSEFPVEISLSPLETDQGLLIISIIRDISARKQAEQARRAVEAQYRELVENLPVGVYRDTPGPEGRFLEVNPAMAAMFEATSSEELLTHRVSELYCDPAARIAFSDKVMQQGHVHAEEVCMQTLCGGRFHAAITAVAKQDSAGAIYFDGIVEDISARKESEERIKRLNDSLRERAAELETSNRELEAFSYSVSHDLRAPLRAMDGFSRILLDQYADRLDEKGVDRLNRVRAAAQQMSMLIDDLLNLSRVSRSELHREVVDLSALAGEVLEGLRQSAPERTMQCAVQPGLSVRGDARLLRVVLENLLGNAWKFTGGRAAARIDVGSRPEGKDLSYFVRDNGAGFDMTYADKLFGAFQRLHDANEFPGTGIGLATVQRVIHKHGGRIWAQSAVGHGATFYFTLQQAEA